MNHGELQEAYGDPKHWEGRAAETFEDNEPLNWFARARLNNSYERVAEFHRVFGHPIANKPVVPTDDRVRLRLALILEEAIELADAMGFYTDALREGVDYTLQFGQITEGDIIGIADALGDLDYVVNGAALEHGIPLPEVTSEIHRSNMTKLGPDGKPIYRADGKVLKSEGYEPPRLEKVLWPE